MMITTTINNGRPRNAHVNIINDWYTHTNNIRVSSKRVIAEQERHAAASVSAGLFEVVRVA